MENIILEEGMKAPDFILPGSDEKDHKLSDYLGKKLFYISIQETIHLDVQEKQKHLEIMLKNLIKITL